MTNWTHGEKTALAKRSGVSRSYLCDVLKGRKRATPENATRIAEASDGRLTRLDLLYPHESENPLVEAKR